MGAIPQNFDWVNARAKCSAEVVFTQLLAGVKSDVALIEQVRKMEPGTGFHVQPITAKRFEVFRIGTTNPTVAFFHVDDKKIEIEDGGKGTTYAATLTINHEGRCKLRIGDEELEQWQVRHMALEALFFGR